MQAIYDNDGALRESSYREECPKCKGTGRFQAISTYGYMNGGYGLRDVGPCFACKGIGYKTFKTAPQSRMLARTAAASRKARSMAENVGFFNETYPEKNVWIGEAAARGFEFAASMRDAVIKYGELTEGQHAAIDRCMARDAERNTERAARAQAAEAAAPAISTDKLMAAFDAARSAGLKRLKMRFLGFEASPAPATGKNPGAIYVKDGEQYLGKIQNGKFFASRECGPDVAQSVAHAMNDPMAAAVAFGKQTGSCCCCGRELTDPVSVENGIGPICANKFGL